MGILRKLIRNLVPKRNYTAYETEKIKTGTFTAIRRKKTNSPLSKVLNSISFFIAALCIFEAAVWFSTGFPEPANNSLRIQYLETRISLHQPYSVKCPFEVTSQIVASFALCITVLAESPSLSGALREKHRPNEEDARSLSVPHPAQSRTDYVVWAFLTLLASPKKSDRWRP